jgi:hypothetical protein
MFTVTPIHKSYGKPWSKLLGDAVVSPEMLTEIGKILVKFIVKEAKADLVKQGNDRTPRHEPEGIPKSENFFKSFSYRVSGTSSVEITSTWPWVNQIIEGRDAYRMVWLTREKGVGIVPLRPSKGTVILKMAPGRKHAWIHPGFARHNFISRGMKKAKKSIDEAVRQRMIKAIKRGKSTNLK